jgi:hypothetical protein
MVKFPPCFYLGAFYIIIKNMSRIIKNYLVVIKNVLSLTYQNKHNEKANSKNFRTDSNSRK